ncbi:hypothetical protein HDU89_004968 [Geranomyces variabilis]|nr:hypothetical protein HDU89_004968 [Geranomyces variabilis]
MAPAPSDLWKTVMYPFVRLTEHGGVEPAAPTTPAAPPSENNQTSDRPDSTSEDESLNASSPQPQPPLETPSDDHHHKPSSRHAEPPTAAAAAASTTPSSDPAKYRRQSVVLPSYEPELLPDNKIVPESAPKQLLQRALYTATRFLRMGPTAVTVEPRRKNLLERFVQTPHSVKRIVVIGIHGWFPGRLLQRVVGEPTGTSSRFAEKMGLAVRSYFSEKYAITLGPEAMTLMPLEGEGKVEDRTELLYRQLHETEGWHKKLQEADMIFVAAHSQGTPVSILLLSRLISENLIDTSRQKVAFLAMAGITHGPYPALKTSTVIKYFEADAARELFDFNEPNSTISKKYHIAMRHVLSCGLRVTAVGSWYDQVVPLYSAVMHGFHHPNIYRGLFIAGVDFIPDFLSHLVVFGLKLRNAGLSDHNLVVHVSDILAGNLYGFGTQGHSAIYEELNTYTLAIAWAMGSKPKWSIPPLPRAPYTSNLMISQGLAAPARLNPYYLPWIMARLFDDVQIRANPELNAELAGLLKMFDVWEPSSKQLKELKYRLEPLKSKL